MSGIQEALPAYDEDYPEGDLDVNVAPRADEPGGPWFDMPSSIMTDPVLDPLTKLYAVYMVRAAALGLQFDDVTIAGLMGVNALTIPKHKKALTKHGYWQERPGEGRNGETLYLIAVDPH
jgi:hypothetical protein